MDDKSKQAMYSTELTKKEKEEIDKLKKDFNIVKENNNHIIIASRRVEVSRIWAKHLLSASFILNCITVICFLIAMFFVLNREQPEFYGTTPNGKIYRLNSAQSIDTLIMQHQVHKPEQVIRTN